MQKLSLVTSFTALLAISSSAAAQTAIPDLRGTWKGESESVVLGGPYPHHPAAQPNEPRFTSTPFTLIVRQQNGRRFFGTFSSPFSTEPLIGVISRNGTILAVDDDGYANGSMLAPNRLEMCYQHVSSTVRIASCVELTKE